MIKFFTILIFSIFSINAATKPSVGLNNMPLEIRASMFTYLDSESRIALAQTCTTMRDAYRVFLKQKIHAYTAKIFRPIKLKETLETQDSITPLLCLQEPFNLDDYPENDRRIIRTLKDSDNMKHCILKYIASKKPVGFLVKDIYYDAVSSLNREYQQYDLVSVIREYMGGIADDSLYSVALYHQFAAYSLLVQNGVGALKFIQDNFHGNFVEQLKKVIDTNYSFFVGGDEEEISQYKVIFESQLKAKRLALEKFFKERPYITLVVDVDRVDENGALPRRLNNDGKVVEVSPLISDCLVTTDDHFVGHRDDYFFVSDLELKTIVITNVKRNFTSMGDGDFLRDFQTLKKVDLTGLRLVKKTGFCFLSGSSVVEIDLSPLYNCESINECFLYEAKNLQKVELSYFKKVRGIAGSFMKGCDQVTKLDFSGMTSLQSISGFELLFTDGIISRCFLTGPHNNGVIQAALGDAEHRKTTIIPQKNLNTLFA